jgi:hypothetical protein
LAVCAGSELYRAVKFAPVLTPFPAPLLSGAALSSGQFSFSLSGVTGYSYAIEASADLVNWVAVQTNTAPFTFAVTNTGNFPQQFYRAACQQQTR